MRSPTRAPDPGLAVAVRHLADQRPWPGRVRENGALVRRVDEERREFLPVRGEQLVVRDRLDLWHPGAGHCVWPICVERACGRELLDVDSRCVAAGQEGMEVVAEIDGDAPERLVAGAGDLFHGDARIEGRARAARHVRCRDRRGSRVRRRPARHRILRCNLVPGQRPLAVGSRHSALLRRDGDDNSLTGVRRFQASTMRATIEMQAGWPRASNGSRKVRTPQGRTLGKPQAAKADGKWHRKETATGTLEMPGVRVKRWGKSPPASWRHGG